jgi:EAL and modified HD-GYP domain-containing signal transduction protein
VARQPIFDRASQTAGYEILFRRTAENRYDATDHDAATAISIEQSLTAFGFDFLVGDRQAYVNLTRDALVREYYKLLPRERTVIELLEAIQPDAEVIEACRRARAQGYTLALDDYAGKPESEAFLPLVDVVKVDLRLYPAGFEPEIAERLRAGGRRLLAEKVESREENQRVLAAGYDLVQGFYYCKPQMLEARDLPPSKLSQLRFLTEVTREDASFEKLEEVFREDVGLTMRLLRYLNSAAFGWRHEVTSLHHALALMGLSPLRKWATMMGVLALSEGESPELAVTSLARARFAERLGEPAGLKQQELELFLAGMLSVVDVMVGRPIQEVLANLAVPPSVKGALVEGHSSLSPVLDLVTTYERGDWGAVDIARQKLGLDGKVLDEAYVSSLQWAEQTTRV